MFSIYNFVSFALTPGYEVNWLWDGIEVLIILGYLYFAVALKSYLNPQKVKFPQAFAIATFVYSLAWAVYYYLQDGSPPGLFFLVDVVIVILLYTRLKKIAR